MSPDSKSKSSVCPLKRFGKMEGSAKCLQQDTSSTYFGLSSQSLHDISSVYRSPSINSGSSVSNQWFKIFTERLLERNTSKATCADDFEKHEDTFPMHKIFKGLERGVGLDCIGSPQSEAFGARCDISDAAMDLKCATYPCCFLGSRNCNMHGPLPYLDDIGHQRPLPLDHQVGDFSEHAEGRGSASTSMQLFNNANNPYNSTPLSEQYKHPKSEPLVHDSCLDYCADADGILKISKPKDRVIRTPAFGASCNVNQTTLPEEHQELIQDNCNYVSNHDSGVAKKLWRYNWPLETTPLQCAPVAENDHCLDTFDLDLLSSIQKVSSIPHHKIQPFKHRLPYDEINKCTVSKSAFGRNKTGFAPLMPRVKTNKQHHLTDTIALDAAERDPSMCGGGEAQYPKFNPFQNYCLFA